VKPAPDAGLKDLWAGARVDARADSDQLYHSRSGEGAFGGFEDVGVGLV
jgi:hypothetical protein